MMDKATMRQFGKKLLVFIVAAIAFSAITQLWDYNDDAQRGAERFLMQNAEVNRQVGKISSHSLNKRIYVASSEGRSSYREYRYLVIGTKLSATITVRVVYAAELDVKPRYSIIEIKPR